MGSPPPAGSKKDVLKLRSVNNIVIAPANTGTDNKSKTAVNSTLHTNKGSKSTENFLILIIVVIKLIEPRILLIPAKCKEKILKSTDIPE